MEPVFECIFEPTVEIVANRKRHYARRSCIVGALAAFVFGGYLISLPFHLGYHSPWIFFSLFGVVYVAWMLFLPEINAFFTVRRFKKDTDGEGLYHICFGEKIEVWQGKMCVQWDYSNISEVVRLKYTYELQKNKRLALMVEPNSFTKGTFEDFKVFLCQKRPDLKIPE